MLKANVQNFDDI